jgi:inner membrane protein
MDPLTHTATGLFLSRAGLKDWTPRGTAILLLAANAPDIDIVASFGGSLNYLHYHRHLTHSLAASPVIALLPVLLVGAVSRKHLNWRGAFFVSWIAVLSHLLLDFTNSYGIRLLLPFSGEWLRLDVTNVIDLWIWAVFLFSIGAPYLARLVTSEITSGAPRSRSHGRGSAVFALAFLVAYSLGRGVLHARAIANLESHVYQGEAPLRVAALPDAANPLRWRGLAETRHAYAVAEVDLTRDFDPSAALVFHKAASYPAIDAARRTHTFQVFLTFAQFPYWRVTPVSEPEGGKRVDVLDMRFGSPAAPGFMASATLDAQLRAVETSFTFGTVRPR